MTSISSLTSVISSQRIFSTNLKILEYFFDSSSYKYCLLKKNEENQNEVSEALFHKLMDLEAFAEHF